MILNQQRKVRVAMRPLEHFLESVRKELALRKADVTVCLVSDREMAGMNEKFREKMGPTDVLSFPANDEKEGSLEEASREKKPRKNPRRRKAKARGYLGDIAIAPETARRYAKKDGRKLKDELRILILHGVLHLLGYDHETDNGEMNRLENKLRRRLGLS